VVTPVASAEQGLAVLRQYGFDAVLTDYALPAATIELVLFISSASVHSTAALRNIRQVLAAFEGQVKLTCTICRKTRNAAKRTASVSRPPC